jgi:Putative intracellular protease/amidase
MDMKTIFLFLTTGFEEIEALGTVDVLRRGGLDVKTVSLTDSKQVVASHQIPVIADLMFDEVDFSTAEMLVLPGGTTKFNEHEGLKKELARFCQQRRKGCCNMRLTDGLRRLRSSGRKEGNSLPRI